MNLQKAYQIMQENCGIKVGDTVRVLKKVESKEMGWSAYWNSEMDKFVGCECEVVSLFNNGGIRLFNPSYIQSWNFPFFVLEKIQSKPIREVTMTEVCEQFGEEVKIKKE